jgi:hypothetical protein
VDVDVDVEEGDEVVDVGVAVEDRAPEDLGVSMT